MFKIFPIILILSTKLITIQSNELPIVFDFDDYILFLTKVLNELPKTACVDQFQNLIDGFSNGEEWALRMIDASAKIQSGILMGNIFQLGNYDECLEIDAKVATNRIRGQYCTAALQPHPEFAKNLTGIVGDLTRGFIGKGEPNLIESIRLSYGLCVPKICTIEDLQNITDVLVNATKSPFFLRFYEETCDGGDPKPYTPSVIFAIVVFSTFAAVIVFSTLYDIFLQANLTNSGRYSPLLISFSFLTNGKKLLTVNQSKDNINCLDGIRVISMMWIIIAHLLQSRFYTPQINLTDGLKKWIDSKGNAFLMAGPIAVDTFFVVSGLLVVYLTMKSVSKGVKLSLPTFYLHRILRLFPGLAMVVLFSGTLMSYMGHGPFWPIVHEMYEKSCETNWWQTLIFLQNYIVSPEGLCVGLAWYVAVDTQMYFISPVILLPLARWPKQTLSAVVLVILLIWSYVFTFTWINQLGTSFLDLDKDVYQYLYYPTHVRGSVYLIGMICGYIVYKTKTSHPLKLTKFQVAVLWLSSLALMIGICFAHQTILSATEYNVLHAALFNSFTRIGWALALSVIIVLCANDYGGFINAFLSNKIFAVLIRVNYSFYLIHPTVLGVIEAQGRTTGYFTNLTVFLEFWGYYVFSLGTATIWTLAFESPVLVLEKIAFGHRKGNGLSKQKNKSNEDAMPVK